MYQQKTVKSIKSCITAFILLFLLPLALSAAETGFSSYFGSYGLSEYAGDESEYSPFYQWGGNFYYRDSSGGEDALSYKLELDLDPVLKYRLKSELEFGSPRFILSLGPVFGIINQSWTLIKPGFSASIKTQIPGKVFFELGAELIPQGTAAMDEDYSSSSSYFTLGFYIKRDHILCYYTQKRDIYSSLSSADTKREEKISYLFFTDFYEKNSILKVQSKLGYEIQNQMAGENNYAEIKNILLGLQLDFKINGNASVFTGLDNRIFPISTGSHKLTGIPGYFFTFTTGLKLSSYMKMRPLTGPQFILEEHYGSITRDYSVAGTSSSICIFCSSRYLRT